MGSNTTAYRETGDRATRVTDRAAHTVPLWWDAIRELALVAGLFGLYEAGRSLAVGEVARATVNADNVWSFERALHLPSEAAMQAPFLAHPDLARAANIYYASVHFPLTIAVLVLLWALRPTQYRRTRTILGLVTFAGLLVHLTFPLAPPRMLSSMGMVDLAARFGPQVYGPPNASEFSNQYAAMPSLHVAWAVIVAIAVIRATRSRWRWLALAHPVLTVTVVVVTGNHYWVDGMVAVLLVAAFGSVYAVATHPEAGSADLRGVAASAGPRGAFGRWLDRRQAMARPWSEPWLRVRAAVGQAARGLARHAVRDARNHPPR